MFAVLTRLYGEVFDLATMTARLPRVGRVVPASRAELPGRARPPRAGHLSIATKASGRSAIASAT
jgi:hypothetical protein